MVSDLEITRATPKEMASQVHFYPLPIQLYTKWKLLNLYDFIEQAHGEVDSNRDDRRVWQGQVTGLRDGETTEGVVLAI